MADDLEEALSDVAAIIRHPGSAVTLQPHRGDALAVTWSDNGDTLQVETLGGPGGRFELGRDEADAALLEDIVHGVVAGRAVEVFGGRDRSRLTVTLSDGTPALETGYEGLTGCLPRPGWRRTGRTIQYAPYRG